MNKNIARILLISAGLLWGLGFIGNKYVLDSGWNDSQLIFIRFFTATILIFIIFFKRIIKTNFYVIKYGIFLGIFLYLGFFFQTWGLVYTTPSNNAIVTASYIALMPLLAFIIDRKIIPTKTIIAGVITMIGVSLISVDFKELTIAIGDALTFIGAFFFSLHIYILGRQSKKVDLYVLMSFQLLTFSFFAFIMLLIRGGLPPYMFAICKIDILIVAIALGVFGSLIGFLFQSIGQKHTNEAEAAILISTESVFGPLFGILFYSDPFNIFVILGVLLVFGGIILSEIDIAHIPYFGKNKTS